MTSTPWIDPGYRDPNKPLSPEEDERLQQISGALEQSRIELEERQELAEAQLRQQEADNLQAGQGQPEQTQQPEQSTPQPEQPSTEPQAEQPQEERKGSLPGSNSRATRIATEALFAPVVGTIDGFSDFYNYLAPGTKYDIPRIPKFQDENLEVIRVISSYVAPTMAAGKLIKGALWGLQGLKALPTAARSLGSNPIFRGFVNLSADGAAGAIVDQTNAHSEDHNMQRQLRDVLQTPAGERLFGIFPPDWATLDTDSPDIKRAKNRNEGFGFGIFTAMGEGLLRILQARKSAANMVRFRAQDQTASQYFKRSIGDEFSQIKYSDDAVEDSLLRSQARAERNLDELGEFYVAKANEENILSGKPFQTADELEFPEPVKGIHDMFDPVENGVRNADPDGVVGAMTDAARIKHNVGTRYGRLGSMITESALKYGLEVDNMSKAMLVDSVKEHIKKSGKFDAVINGKVLTAQQIDEAGTELAEIMADMNPGEMQIVLESFKKQSDELQYKVVNKVGYDAVFKQLKTYMDTFVDLDAAKARAYLTTSLAGQASDMAGELRNLEGTPAIEAAREMIFNRMEYLMYEKALASYDAGNVLQSMNVWKRIQRLADGKGAKDYALDQMRKREEFLGTLIPNIKGFTATLLDISENNPKFLQPLFDAYHLTDGKIQSMYSLNNYVFQNLGQIEQAFLRGEGTMPNLIVQGFWSNYYNSILSSTVTPIKAAVANVGGLIARPVNTVVGTMVSGEFDKLNRVWTQYAGFTDAFQNAWGHMGHFWRKTLENPQSTMEYGRADLAIKRNEDNIAMLRKYADAASDQGEHGPEFLLNMYEDMHYVASNPFFRYSANIMGAADAFVRAFIATSEARGIAYDKIFVPGKKITRSQMKEASDYVYQSMVDKKTGWITDKATDYYSREIALNLDTPASQAFTELINHQPWLKPFFLFPRTSVNMLSMFQKYSPLSFVSRDFWDLVGYGKIDDVPIEHIKAFMERKGLPFDQNSIQVFDQMRREAKGRIATGTLSIAGATFMFTSGRLRGTGHWDKERQRVRNDLDWKKKTYLGWDNKWYSYEFLGPIGDWLAAVADIHDNFDLITTPAKEKFMEKAGYVLAASLTNRSVMAMVEPLNDVLTGNPLAANRWGSNFINGVIPFSGLRNQAGQLLSDGLKELDQDLLELTRNRNNWLDQFDPDGALGEKYDWVDGKKIGYVEDLWQRAFNVATGMHQTDRLSPERQFLVDIEFDRRPTFQKNNEGITYSSRERSALQYEIGRQGLFSKRLKAIMREADSRDFIETLRRYRQNGVGTDPTTGGVAAEKYMRIYSKIQQALEEAKHFAARALDERTRHEISVKEHNKRMNEGMAERGTFTLDKMYK